MRLRLVNTGRDAVAGFELTFTSVVQLDPAPPARLVGRLSGCHVVAPPAGFVLEPGRVWELTATCGHRPGHANDGPASAYVTLADGTVLAVEVGSAHRVTVGAAAPATYRADGHTAAAALAAVAARDSRLHPYRPVVLGSTGEHAVAATIDDSMPEASFRLSEAGGGWLIEAGSPLAVERALTVLSRAARDDVPPPVGEHVARHEWRGLHVDLARQFLPAADVEWVIDVAAWHGLNRLHLHLTDDEAWRFPVVGYERLTDVGAWRGRGLAVPPLLGSGAAPYGGVYDRTDIARWHELAGSAGITIVPEVDLPGHSFAALAAVPELADPEDTSGARSVQHFVDNALNPGVDATWPFLEAVFGSLADAFSSPWLHLGGDEVAPGAWVGIARRASAGRRPVTSNVRTRSGRRSCVRSSRSSGESPVGRWACGRRAPTRWSQATGTRWRGRPATRAVASPTPVTTSSPRRRPPRTSTWRRPSTGTSPARAGPGTRRSLTSPRSTPPTASPPPSASTCSACRRASGRSTCTTAPRSNDSSSPA